MQSTKKKKKKSIIVQFHFQTPNQKQNFKENQCNCSRTNQNIRFLVDKHQITYFWAERHEYPFGKRNGNLQYDFHFVPPGKRASQHAYIKIHIKSFFLIIIHKSVRVLYYRYLKSSKADLCEKLKHQYSVIWMSIIFMLGVFFFSWNLWYIISPII